MASANGDGAPLFRGMGVAHHRARRRTMKTDLPSPGQTELSDEQLEPVAGGFPDIAEVVTNLTEEVVGAIKGLVGSLTEDNPPSTY
jgi:hypothetical protein